MSPIIGKRGRANGKEGVIVWMGATPATYDAPRIVLLDDEGIMTSHSASSTLVLGPVAEVYR